MKSDEPDPSMYNPSDYGPRGKIEEKLSGLVRYFNGDKLRPVLATIEEKGKLIAALDKHVEKVREFRKSLLTRFPTLAQSLKHIPEETIKI